MIPGKIAIEAAQATLQSSITARSFSYKNQRYGTIEGLVTLLPSWSFPGAIKAYALPNRLVENFQQYIPISKPFLNREQLESEYRLIQTLQIQLEQERKRVKALLKSIWTRGSQREYLEAWLNIIFVQRLSIEQTLDHLNGVALFLSARKPVSLEVVPFPGQTLNADGKALTIPLPLRAYSPLVGRLWRWWFRRMGYYRFLKSKQARFQTLTLSFNLPSHDAELIKRTKEDITQEQTKTQALITQSRFYQFTWRAFLKGWMKALARAFNTLEQAEAIWHKRLEAYNNTLLEDLYYQLNQDTFSLTLIEPEKFEYRNEDEINESLTKLQNLLDKFKTHEQSYSDLSAAGYLLNAGGEELKQAIQKHLEDIFTKKEILQDISLLNSKKNQLPKLPSSEDMSAITLNNFASNPFIIQLQGYEDKARLAMHELSKSEELAFHSKEYIARWHKYVNACLDNIISLQIEAVDRMMNLIYQNRECNPINLKDVENLIDKILSNDTTDSLKPEKIACLERIKVNIHNLQEDSTILVTSSNDADDNLESFKRAELILTNLSTEKYFYDVNTMRSLCAFYHDLNSQKEMGGDGSFQQEQLNKLERLFELVIPLALRIFEKQLNQASHSDVQFIDKKKVEEVLCFGLLLSLNTEAQLKQQSCLNTYLIHQLKYLAGKSALSFTDADNLLTFETLLLELCPELDSKLQVLQEYRENQDWTGYQIYCGQWHALLTQPPASTLSGIGLFTPSQESANTSEPTVAPVASI